MAQKLHDTYNYSYDNLKVLQGGWNIWLEKNAADPTGYPTGKGATSAQPTVQPSSDGLPSTPGASNPISP